jgi:hypothetical protein
MKWCYFLFDESIARLDSDFGTSKYHAVGKAKESRPYGPFMQSKYQKRIDGTPLLTNVQGPPRHWETI